MFYLSEIYQTTESGQKLFTEKQYRVTAVLRYASTSLHISEIQEKPLAPGTVSPPINERTSAPSAISSDLSVVR
jgi:hypothetical protein